MPFVRGESEKKVPWSGSGEGQALNRTFRAQTPIARRPNSAPSSSPVIDCLRFCVLCRRCVPARSSRQQRAPGARCRHLRRLRWATRSRGRECDRMRPTSVASAQRGCRTRSIASRRCLSSSVSSVSCSELYTTFYSNSCAALDRPRPATSLWSLEQQSCSCVTSSVIAHRAGDRRRCHLGLAHRDGQADRKSVV